MSEFVVDASAALAWLVLTQATDASAAFLADRDQDRFVAPHIFSWEVGNVLLTLHRRRALSREAHREVLARVADFEVNLERALSEHEIADLALFAREAGLTLFDAAYVSLAIERNARLVSRDADLLRVAAMQGVSCIDLNGVKP